MSVLQRKESVSEVVVGSSYPIPDIKPLRAGEKVLLIVPHQDDEALACSGLMQHAVSLSVPFQIVLATDGGRWGSWMKGRRRRELLRATGYAGLHPSMIEFLDYPDGSLASQGNLGGRIAECIRRFQPTRIITTDPEDIHSDHAALGKHVLACKELPDSVERIYGALVHYPRFPRPIGRKPSAFMHPPKPLTGPALPLWETYRLSEHERTVKRRVLKSYRSQGAAIPAVGWLFNSFDRPNELFRVLR